MRLFVFFCIAGILASAPILVGARGLVPCGGQGEPACESCHVVSLANNVISWLVLILGTIAAIVIIYAGVKLVTSAGNQGAMESAKSMITNIIIGYVIVLAGWLIVDYVMKVLLDEGRFGVWNELICTQQVVPGEASVRTLNFDLPYVPLDSGLGGIQGWVLSDTAATGGPGGSNAPGSFTAACRLLPGPPGVSEYDCAAQRTQCTSAGGTATPNSAGSAIICAPAQVSAGSGGGSGSCTVVSDPSNACNPNRLTCFPDRNLASKICNLESGGGNTNIMSGTDLCQDGRSFSVGLWQINILANRTLIPGCTGTFFTSDNGGRSEGSCISHRTNSRGVQYCQFRSCRITNVATYNRCVSNARIPANNTNAACSLMGSQGWGAWATSYNQCR